MSAVDQPIERDAEPAKWFVILADTLLDDFDLVELLDELTRRAWIFSASRLRAGS